MVEAVVFDLGKVLVDFDYRIAARRVAARCALTAGELFRFMVQTPLIVRYETGLITGAEFYREISAATGYKGSMEEFGGFFGDIFTPIEPMIRLHAELRTRGMPTYVFSNTNDLAVLHIRRNFPFFEHFDGYVFSYEHRSMKPDAKLYEVVERVSGRRGGEILYIDDRLENVEAGAARGWQTILQEEPEALLKWRRAGLSPAYLSTYFVG